jgi:hypothetical protein
VISKCLVCPYFGEYPPWWKHWLANTEHLRELGYEFLFDNDEDAFRERVRRVLDIECPPMFGTGKVWDFRPALGLLYREELRGFDFWGHTDFDCVYGRVDQFVTDDFLREIDMHSDCADYVNGPWSLYRNTTQMRELFLEEPMWQPIMEDPVPTGWAEKEFSEIIRFAHDEASLVKAWTQWQIFEPSELGLLRLAAGGRLLCGKSEVFMAHFRRTKVYPAGCVV